MQLDTALIKNIGYKAESIHTLEHGLEDLLPFKELLFYFRDGGDQKIIWYAKIKRLPDSTEEDGQRLYVEVIIPHEQECYVPTYTVSFVPGGVNLMDQNIRFSKKTAPTDKERALEDFFPNHHPWERDKGQDIPLPIIPVVGVINALIHFEEQDQRPVVVQRKTSFKDKQLDRKTPGARKDLQSVVYLDSIPEDHQSSKGQGEPLKMGHRRRGHWRQLTHPRYKTKRKVRVRPSWVGPDQWSHNGTLYKLMHNDVINS